VVITDPFVVRTVSDTGWSYAWFCLLHLHFTHEEFVWMAWAKGRSFPLDFELYLYKRSL